MRAAAAAAAAAASSSASSASALGLRLRPPPLGRVPYLAVRGPAPYLFPSDASGGSPPSSSATAAARDASAPPVGREGCGREEPSASAAAGAVRVCSALGPGGRLVDYARGWAWQQALLNRRLDRQRRRRNAAAVVGGGGGGGAGPGAGRDDDDEDRLLLFEHSPAYTLGRGADESHLTFLDGEPDGGAKMRSRLSRAARGAGSARLSADGLARGWDVPIELVVDALLAGGASSSPVAAPNGAPIYRVERGGEVTFHGPGQLVAYPLLDLRKSPYRKDLHWYLRQVEEVVISTLREYDIEGVRDEINTGVWVGPDKVAAVGVSSSRWITTHGFALNVDPDLTYFDNSVMIPCGIEGRGVTSIAEILRGRRRGGGAAEMAVGIDGEGCEVPSVGEVADVVVHNFGEVFGVPMVLGGNLH